MARFGEIEDIGKIVDLAVKMQDALPKETTNGEVISATMTLLTTILFDSCMTSKHIKEVFHGMVDDYVDSFADFIKQNKNGKLQQTDGRQV